MKKQDVLLRTEIVLNNLYNEINKEDWTCDEELYKKQMDDYFIISNALSELIQYRYNENMTKEEYKESIGKLIEIGLRVTIM